MRHAHAARPGVVLHGGRSYDLAFGWLIRRTDAGVLAHAGVAPGDRVLDIGTGPGYLALAASRIAGAGGRAVGIDASPEMIDRARALAARSGSGAEYLVASADALPFADGSFDIVVSRLVMHHLAADAKPVALAEMKRVLAPGGRALLVDLASPAAQTAHHVAAHLLGSHPATDASLGRLLWDVGFADITTGTLARGLLAGARGVRP